MLVQFEDLVAGILSSKGFELGFLNCRLRYYSNSWFVFFSMASVYRFGLEGFLYSGFYCPNARWTVIAVLTSDIRFQVRPVWEFSFFLHFCLPYMENLRLDRTVFFLSLLILCHLPSPLSLRSPKSLPIFWVICFLRLLFELWQFFRIEFSFPLNCVWSVCYWYMLEGQLLEMFVIIQVQKIIL